MRLDLVTIVVPDYDPAIRFFCDVLGFAVESDVDEGRKRWVVVRPPMGGTGLLLARAATQDQAGAIGRQAGGRVGFFLHVEDFAGTQAKLEASGIPFEEPPRQEPYGMIAVFRDPFGNRWDLIEPT